MKDLNEYLDKAAKQNEIVPLAEIEEMISRKARHAEDRMHGSSLLLRRNAFALGTISAVIILAASVLTLVLHPHETPLDEEVFVPDGQRRVMRLVKNISAHPSNGEIAVSQFGSPAQHESIPIHLRSKFELSEDKLKLLGITFTDSLIRYEGNVKGGGYVSFSVLKTISTSVSVDHNQWPGVREYDFYPWFLTDEVGFQGVKYRFESEPALKMTNSFFYNVIDQLIPIQVNRPGFKKVIFWFSQTPELMKILESAAMISKNNETSHRSGPDKTKGTIEIEIFPTITTGDVQVITRVLKEQKLEISLLNSSGEVLTIPVNNQVLKEGTHNFSMDLSNLKKGLYFVRIKSDPGVITFHRLFKV